MLGASQVCKLHFSAQHKDVKHIQPLKKLAVRVCQAVCLPFVYVCLLCYIDMEHWGKNVHLYLLVSISRLVVSYIALALKDLQISAISKKFNSIRWFHETWQIQCPIDFYRSKLTMASMSSGKATSEFYTVSNPGSANESLRQLHPP